MVNMVVDADYLVMPDDVTVIEEGAFRNNKKLRHADLRNVRVIGAMAFQECTGLESVVMSKAAVIGPMAFEFCRSLKSIVIGDVEEIGRSAFSHCDELDITRFPETLRTVGTGAFSHTATKRADIGWLEEIPPYLFAGCVSLEQADIRNAKVIGERAFSMCESLERVRFDSAEEIGDYAFYNCESFVVQRLPECLRSIGAEALCRIREGLVIPQGVRHIGCSCLGPSDVGKSIRIYRSCLYEFRNYYLDERHGEAWEEEHFYMHESATDVTVLDDATGEITGLLPLYSDLEKNVRDALYKAFRPDNSFDYSVLDRELFYEMRWNQRGKDRLAVSRMTHPYELAPDAEKQYTDYLSKHSVRIAERAVKAEDVGMLTFLYERGLIRAEDITGILDLSIRVSAHDCTAFLLKCQSELGCKPDELFDDL